MTGIESITFPDGLYGQKLRYLDHGFRMLGIRTDTNTTIKRQIAVPIDVQFRGRPVVHAFLDVWVEKSKVVKGLVDGKNFYFKTHLDTALFPNSFRIFPMPQALGHTEYLDLIGPFRRARRGTVSLPFQVFGAFAYSPQRARACEIVRAAGFTARYLGVNKDRHGTANFTCPRLLPQEYLQAMAKARIALSFPSCHGENGPWCSFRNVEAWALGVPLLTIEPRNYALIASPRPFWFETAPSLDDLTDVLTNALMSEERCRDFSARSIDYFESHLRPECHALYFLRTIENELERTI